MDGIRQVQDTLVAEREGVVVKQDTRLSVIPFYMVLKDLDARGKNVDVDGTLYIKGNVKGPMVLKADDIYVEGNLQDVTVIASGDVFIKGGVAGKNKTDIRSEGHFYSKFLSDCKVKVFGDMKIKEAITYSDILCSGRVNVLSPNGQIVGGVIQALKEVSCASYGSDFGTLTKVHVGHDFLTKISIDEIKEEMKSASGKCG